MAIWHLRSKRRVTGALNKKLRKKRRGDLGTPFLEPRIGPKKVKMDRVSGGNKKIRVLSTDEANVADPKTGKITKTKILTVSQNPANPHFVRRNIITKGAIIKTDLGMAKVTSRPNQVGVVNAVLVEKK